MKVKSMKGFTLAELLIVMAIIVVLAAIAIPTFGKQLETARESADAEAIRAALTDAFSVAFTDYANAGEWTHGDGAKTAVYTRDVQITQKSKGFQYVVPKYNVGGSVVEITSADNVEAGAVKNTVSFTFAPGAAGNESSITLSSIAIAKVDE